MASRKTPEPPAITVTRPSIETPRPAAQAQRNETNIDTPQLKWLRTYGIPTYPDRLTKGRARTILGLPTRKQKSSEDTDTTVTDASRSISASNVSALELERFFNWTFISNVSLILNSDTYTSTSDLIKQAIQLVGESSEPDHHLFSLPVEWRRLEETLNAAMALNDDEFWRSAVLRLISIHDPNQNFVYFKPERAIQASKFPIPNIFNLHNPQYTTGGIGWTLLNLLAAPTYFVNTPVRSEMTVERSNGSLLAGFFNVPECEASSNTQVKFPNEISCFGSFRRPDYATRVLVDRLSQINDPELCPVVFLGEGKKVLPQSDSGSIDLNLLSPEQTQKNSRYTAQLPKEGPLRAKSPMVTQMAFAAHSTLVLIVASLIEGWLSSSANKKQKPRRKDFEIPSYALIYGIAYGSDGILIYGFSPYIMEYHSNNYPKRWGFVSVLVNAEFANIFEGRPSFPKRARFIRILSILQQHANRLKDEMKNLKLPSVFQSARN